MAHLNFTCVPGPTAVPVVPHPPRVHSDPRLRKCRECTARVSGVADLHVAPRNPGGFAQSSPRTRFCAREKRECTSSRAAIDLPPIDGDLTEALLDSGADVDSNGVAVSFGNDDEALEAAHDRVAVYNMTHFGRIRVSGDDRIRFLHNQTSADLQSLKNGEGCFTVFQTATARTIDLAVAWIMERAVIVIVSPSEKEQLLKMMDRFLFPVDKVQLADMTDKTCQLALIGPASHKVLERFGVTGLEGAAFGTHRHFSVDGSPATVAVGSGVALPGYSLLLAADVAGKVWTSLMEAGAVPMGEAAWNRLRVMQGRPTPGAELTKDYNALEAGLWHAISTTKGCYIGQETIARLITYKGVKQTLWGIQLEAPVDPGAALLDDQGQKVGKVTSCVEANDGSFFALGYVKKLDPPAEEGFPVFVEDVRGKLKQVPFLTKELQPVST